MAATVNAGPFGFSDAARRISDTMRQAILDGHRNRWLAFALDDGTTERVPPDVYDTKADAIRHHGNKYRRYCYIRVPWDDVTPRAAEVLLMRHRQLAKLGQHPDDEMAQHELMVDTRREAYPRLDARRIMVNDRYIGRRERRSNGGVILP